jgi:hypothetical protein
VQPAETEADEAHACTIEFRMISGRQRTLIYLKATVTMTAPRRQMLATLQRGEPRGER